MRKGDAKGRLNSKDWGRGIYLGRGPRGSPGVGMGIAGLELGMSKGWCAGELCDRSGKSCIAGQGPRGGL